MEWLTQIIQANKEKILANPSDHFLAADPRPMTLHTLLSERLRADLSEMKSAPEMPDTKSVPVVDRLVKKLAFYMTANNISFPLPAVPQPT